MHPGVHPRIGWENPIPASQQKPKWEIHNLNSKLQIPKRKLKSLESPSKNETPHHPKFQNHKSRFPNRKSKIQISKRNHNPKSQTPHLTPEIRIPKSKIPKSKIQNLNSWIQNPRFRIQISSLQFKIESSNSSWILTFKIETQSSRAIPQVQIILELKNWSPEFESESSSLK